MADFATTDYRAHLTAVEVIGDYVVRITFSDGVVCDADLTRHYVHPSGRPWGDPAAFALVRVDRKSDTLLWPDEFHEHGETLYETYAVKQPQT